MMEEEIHQKLSTPLGQEKDDFTDDPLKNISPELSPCFSPTPSSVHEDEEEDFFTSFDQSSAPPPQTTKIVDDLEKFEDPNDKNDFDSEMSIPLPPHLVQSVMTNPLILREILKYSSPKTARLVSTLWNSTTLSISPPKLCLSLPLSRDQCCQSYEEFVEEMKKIEPKITKQIEVEDLCLFKYDNKIGHSQIKSSSCLASNLIYFCEQYGSNLVYIGLKCELQFIPALFNILQNTCPKLKDLELQIEFNIGQNLELPIRENKVLPMKPHLKRVFFRINEEYMKDEGTATAFEFLQQILNSALNLDFLILENNFYPDLQNNKKLNILHLEGTLASSYPHPQPPRPHSDLIYPFKLAEISRMLNQVKDCLEDLFLEVSQVDKNCSVCKDISLSGDFIIPKMPKLEALAIFGPRIYRTAGFGFSQLPNLVDLTISGKNKTNSKLDRIQEYLEPIIKHPELRMLTFLQILKMEGITDPEFLKELKTTCPQLTDLTLCLSLPEDKNSAKALFGKTLKACDDLGLLLFKIATTFVFPLVRIVNAFEACDKLLEGLECLEVANKMKQENQELTEDILQRFEQVFLKMKKIDVSMLKNLPFTEKDVKRLEDWNEKNEIPMEIYGKFSDMEFFFSF